MSDHDALQIQSLRIDRLHSVPRGQGFSLDDLSPGINIIHGPNGAGKSSTALAIQCLLWPDAPPIVRPTLEGRLTAGDHQWQIELDAGHLTRRRDGREAASFGLASPELRARYHLALHDLIADRGEPFARQVARAMAGDYDVPQAAANLGFTQSPTSPQKGIVKRLADARQTVKQAQQEQADIARESRELPRLEARREEAGRAKAELARLDEAQRLFEAREQYEQLKARLDAMPQGIAKLTGREGDQLDDLTKAQTKKSQDLRDQQRRRDQARQKRDAIDLPEGGVPEQVVNKLNTDSTQLQIRADRIRDTDQKAVTDHREQARQTRKQLADHLEPEQIQALEKIEVEGLNQFATRCEESRADRAMLAKQRQWLEKEIHQRLPNAQSPDHAPPDPKPLEEAAMMLAHWLATPAAPRPASGVGEGEGGWLWPLGLAAVTAGVLAIVLAVMVHPLWAIALVVAAAAGVWGRWAKRDKSAENPMGGDLRAEYRKQYERLDQPAPETWEPQAVADRMHALQQEAERSRLCSSLQDKLSDVADKEASAKQTRSELDQQRERLIEKLGVEPRVDEVWLGAFVEVLRRWQDHHARARAADKVMRESQEKLDADWREFAQSIATYGCDPPQSLTQVDAAVRWLEEQATTYRTASNDLDNAEREINHLEEDLQRMARERAAIFEGVELDPRHDEPTLGDWLGQRDDFLAWRQQGENARAVCDDRARNLADRRDLQALTADQIAERREEYQAKAGEYDALDERIRRINAEIANAKQGHTLADALDEQEAAQEKLADQRDNDAAAAVGAMLAEHVRQACHDQSRPEVLKRADGLLGRLTGGRFGLTLRDDPPAADQSATFLARDARRDEVRPLDELSTGERVQLLLAVRLGFVESEEAGVRLPLLMDETLSTSDDQRAEAIMEAVIELAREGRQVFYFTAQREEVGKWRAKLQATAVGHKLIDLGEVRQLANAQAHPLPSLPPASTLTPAPDGMSREAYGKALGVPAIDPQEAPGNVHLWHILDDMDTLHALLTLGVERLGDALTLIDHGGEALLPDAPALAPCLRAAHRVIGEALDHWRLGRGRPIDRGVLEDSGAVSKNFIEDACELAEHVGHNPAALLEALEAGRLSGWRKSKTAELRDYLQGHDYLDPRSPLDPEALRLRVLAAAGPAIAASDLDAAWVGRLVGSLPGMSHTKPI